MAKLTKRQEYLSTLEEKKYTVSEAVEFLKSGPKSNFEESVDVAINLGIDTSKSDQTVRSATSLPAGTGKTTKVAVFAETEQAQEAIEAGADAVGMEDLSEKIKKGEDDFDVVIATPDTMKLVSPLGKILGPKGLMPNPKFGTVTNEIIKSVKDIKSGQLEMKNDKDGNIALSIGNKSVSDENLIKNFNAVLDVISKEKPSGVKGNFVKSAFVTSTMGISYKLKLNKSI